MCKNCNHGILRASGHGKDLENFVKFTNYYQGDLIIQQGETILGYHILCSGKVKLLRRHEDSKINLLAYIRPGDIIDKFALFTDAKSYSCYAQSVTKSQIGFIEKNDFSYWIEEYPAVARKAIASLANELEYQFKRLTWKSWESAGKRLIRALLILSGESDRDLPVGPMNISLSDLVYALGVARETLSRYIHRLEDKGFVETKKGRITSVNEEELKRYFDKI